ncbi:MAG: hypothetical protein ACK4IX_01360, partial [Candidatus Sericytochromatia bacterium]
MNKIKNVLAVSLVLSFCFSSNVFAEESKAVNSQEGKSSSVNNNVTSLLTLSEAIDIGIQNSYSMKLSAEKI